MISKECFGETYIRTLQKESHRDPILIERVIYAFGLLEALVKVELPFIFKGGTSLMLLLDKPRRLSTDIDIIVEPGTDIDAYIARAGQIFPFKSQEENIRTGKNNIVKRHFRFTYDSPVNRKEFYILLDVLFEKNHYLSTEEREIQNDLLITEGEPYVVTVPSADCILGDKMTAFAPYTTGIPLRSGKDMEVMKQMYDVSSLIDVHRDFDNVCKTYETVCRAEIGYRGISAGPKECLLDTFSAASCIAGKGKINPQDYPVYVKAIHDLHGHIFSEDFSAEIAAIRAPKIMYMVMCILTGKPYQKVTDYTEYAGRQIVNDELKALKSLRKADPEAYAYVIKADELYSGLKS